MTPILEVRGVSKRFGGLLALDRIHFHVKEGEIFGLIGPNGSGKTTLFNLINQFDSLSGGDIFFKGVSIRGKRTHRICRMGIGRTFQIVKPLKRMNVFENVLTSTFCRIPSFREAEKSALNTLEFCNLLSRKDQTAGDLPIEGRKRLEIARALATGPQLLLLDEIAAGLNPTELDEAIRLICRIRDAGVTIMIVEHIMKVIMSISDRIHAIHHGQSIAEGTPSEVAGDSKVVEAYLGESHAES